MGAYYFHDGERLLCAGHCRDGDEKHQPLPCDGAVLVQGDAPCAMHHLQPGEYWSMTQRKAVALPVPETVMWQRVRYQRDQLFAATEWRRGRAQDEGVPIDPGWLAYWQALRDVTQQPDPANITWPAQPET